MTLSVKITPPARIAFIGGAASTLATLAYLVRDLKDNGTEADLHVFDPQGLNEGPAYQVENPAFFLNQPAGEEMDPFHQGGPGLPPSFLHFLTTRYPAETYTAASFVPRALYGEYLRVIRDWIVGKVAATPQLKLIQHHSKVEELDIVGRNATGTPTKFRLHQDTGESLAVDVIVNAQGHGYEPRLSHQNYIPAYIGSQFESRLTALADTSTPESVVTFLGSGASMIDIVGALEQAGYRGQYRAISPYANCAWAYDPNAPVPTGPAAAKLQQLVQHYIDAPTDSAFAPLLRSLVDQAAAANIGPQYVLGALLQKDAVKADPARLSVAKAFYGNPLSAARYAQVEALTRQTTGKTPRLTFEQDRIERLGVLDDHTLSLERLGGTAVETLPGALIDCSVVQRGIRTSSGQIAQPVLRQQIELGLIQDQNGALPIQSGTGFPVFAVGPVTNAQKNGIQTFCPGYKTVAQNIAARSIDCVQAAVPTRPLRSGSAPSPF
jgi:hypothetical protein